MQLTNSLKALWLQPLIAYKVRNWFQSFAAFKFVNLCRYAAVRSVPVPPDLASVAAQGGEVGRLYKLNPVYP
jgi:hypothetical protein